MTDWDALSDVLVDPNNNNSSGVLASDPSSDAEAWLSPVQPDSRFEGRSASTSRVPPLALPAKDHRELVRRSRAAATDPPDTPDLGPSAPAYAFNKPPRPFSKQPKQYERSNLSDHDQVPVNWIGDSTDHVDYRPANTASFSNHEADIVRVATFSTVGQKHDDRGVVLDKQDVSNIRSRRSCRMWAILGVAAGTAIGIAYKVLGDRSPCNVSDLRGQQIRHGFSTKSVDTPVAARYLSKTVSDHEMMQQLMRRRARKVSQT